MDGSQIIVLIGGIAAIALVLWYFFGARQAVQAAETGSGVQEI
jgi:plastocyanin domain-containing protein